MCGEPAELQRVRSRGGRCSTGCREISGLQTRASRQGSAPREHRPRCPGLWVLPVPLQGLWWEKPGFPAAAARWEQCLCLLGRSCPSMGYRAASPALLATHLPTVPLRHHPRMVLTTVPIPIPIPPQFQPCGRHFQLQIMSV